MHGLVCGRLLGLQGCTTVPSHAATEVSASLDPAVSCCHLPGLAVCFQHILFSTGILLYVLPYLLITTVSCSTVLMSWGLPAWPQPKTQTSPSLMSRKGVNKVASKARLSVPQVRCTHQRGWMAKDRRVSSPAVVSFVQLGLVRAPSQHGLQSL
jgi:hypothetical protein